MTQTEQTTFFEPEGMVTIPHDKIFEDATNLGENIWVIDNILNKEICDNVIRFFESQKMRQRDGSTGAGINKNIKDSKDLTFSEVPNEISALFDKYMYERLHFGTQKVVEKLVGYPMPVGWSPDMLFACDTGYQIQKTVPGGKYVWHIENAQSIGCFVTKTAARSLTYILYLNDITETQGGSTGFLYQKIKVQPRAGRLVLFPPYWTHVHAGIPLISGVKYIATGWFFSEAYNC